MTPALFPLCSISVWYLIIPNYHFKSSLNETTHIEGESLQKCDFILSSVDFHTFLTLTPGKWRTLLTVHKGAQVSSTCDRKYIQTVDKKWSSCFWLQTRFTEPSVVLDWTPRGALGCESCFSDVSCNILSLAGGQTLYELNPVFNQQQNLKNIM